MENITDVRVQKMLNIVDDYLTSLNSIKETFDSNYKVLQKSDIAIKRSLRTFIVKHKVNIDDIDNIPPAQTKELKTFVKRIERAELAAVIFPQSMLVSMVSQYDYLIGQLVQFICNVNPNSLHESGSQISYKELFTYADIDAIREKIIQDKVESVLRKSHEEQIIDLQNLSGVKNLKGVSFWKEFIELTQRRNLLVHCKGLVSEQYIKKCKEVGVSSLPCKGDYLTVDEEYFDKAYVVLYTIGVLLSQVIIRHVLKKENVIGEIDTILNNIIYEAIEEERYDIAIMLSEFALADTTEHSCRLDEVYFVLNYAQAYKWQGNQTKCNEILSKFDFSTMKPDILVAKCALENNVEEMVEHMNQTGCSSKIMTKDAYVSWAIFKEMRTKKAFKDAYQNLFNEELSQNLLTPTENRVVQEIES